MAQGFTVFATPIGACGIAWSEHGVIGVQLPEGGEEQSRVRLARRFPNARPGPPPASVGEAIARIIALLGGEPDDLAGVPLDFGAASALHRRVWELARAIPPGKTRAYGEIAADLGDPALAREVGQALGRNPFPIIVPCHRVLAAGGGIGGFSAHGGIDTKRRLLAIESDFADGEPDLFRPARG
ncbi:MAG TPA: methylated-DNA--[protein]-cysteine S-methyltransferase [Caulobacteraceae bacterium]